MNALCRRLALDRATPVLAVPGTGSKRALASGISNQGSEERGKEVMHDKMNEQLEERIETLEETRSRSISVPLKT